MADNPEAAHSHDVPVVATMVDGLRSQVVDGDGTPILATDMPTAVGGEATAPTPGRMMRAALAACDATMITLRAAQLGIKLTILEVQVSAEWDDRGLFDIDTGGEAPAGPLSYQVHVRIGAEGVPEETLRGIVAWCEQHSPVGDALSRAVPGHIHIEVL